ncbi:chromate efflux transporter [Gemmatimonas sp.]|uniref:chromate efflux transporter n=1 Tax=Gemmatimonas sp. TaxID=1962908 RepID=UPI0022BC0EF1|nr:chromate efflux transporter [Gemmatimonas sp.]MCZ8204358.1 chromate efflux transporter [Gemmatimonas sp.]
MPMTPVREVALVFTRLGLTAFGGPAAHIAAMDDELVTRRAWLSRDDFADLIGAANLIPGPNSTELAIHLGYRRAGWPGLVVAGCCFIAPAVLLVWGIAWAYVALGTRVEVQALFQGMQPAVLAVVAQAIWRLKGSLARTRLGVVLAMLAFVGVLLGVSELVLLLGALVAALLYAVLSWRGANASGAGFAIGPWLGLGSASLPQPVTPTGAAAMWTAAGAAAVKATASLSAGALFLSFAKIGSVLFGSGYVLLTFLRGEFVTRLGVLSEAQLLDAIAVGQVTPGPVFSAATFVGYLLGGHAGAAAATAGIFLPAFVGVAVTAPLVARLRRSPVLSRTLDAVNAVTLAFMAGVVLLMARGIALSPWSLAILVSATLLLLGTRVGAGWVLFGGALAGLTRLLITGAAGSP